MMKAFFGFRSAVGGIVLTLIMVLISFDNKAQDCSCTESFEELFNAVEENYAFYAIKVNEGNKKIFDAFTMVMMEQAKSTEDMSACKVILDQWLTFFRDGHISISQKSLLGKKYETVSLSEEEFKYSYMEAGSIQEDLIGIWESTSYRVAIIPERNSENHNRDYLGVILESKNENWKTNDVKFELKRSYGNDFKATFYLGDHSPRKIASKLQNEALLTFESLNDWVKVWPESEGVQQEKSNGLAYQGFHFEILEGGIPYFRFPNFDPSFIESLKSVLEEYHDQLMEANYMVVDVRQNSGGYDSAYYPLMPYVLRGPIQLPNVYFYLSAFNKTQFGLELKEEDIEYLKDEEEKAMYRLFFDNQDTLINFNVDHYTTYNPDTIYGQPKKIAILIGEKTISSGETFVLRSMQSEKVILYGQNTAGIIDGFNGLDIELSCFSLRYPSTLRAFDVAENPIDPYGIAPHVYLDKSVDALDFALNHMKHLED